MVLTKISVTDSSTQLSIIIEGLDNKTVDVYAIFFLYIDFINRLKKVKKCGVFIVGAIKLN